MNLLKNWVNYPDTSDIHSPFSGVQVEICHFDEQGNTEKKLYVPLAEYAPRQNAKKRIASTG